MILFGYNSLMRRQYLALLKAFQSCSVAVCVCPIEIDQGEKLDQITHNYNFLFETCIEWSFVNVKNLSKHVIYGETHSVRVGNENDVYFHLTEWRWSTIIKGVVVVSDVLRFGFTSNFI